MNNKPLLLRPSGKDYLWGGRRLNDEFEKGIDLSPLAETWECSTHPEGPCYVVGGEYDGKELAAVLREHPEYLGERHKGETELPILIKFIDAKKDLSVQVHPTDDYANRERIDNLSREFKEELIDKNIVNWNRILYRYCGRHITELHWGEHFQCYELLLADIIELLPTPEQENDLRNLMGQPSESYRFATAEEIISLGIDTNSGNLRETIADHATKIIQENEGKLIKNKSVGKIYSVTV